MLVLLAEVLDAGDIAVFAGTDTDIAARGPPPRPSAPGRLTIARQLAVMAGEIRELRAEVSALTQAISHIRYEERLRFMGNGDARPVTTGLPEGVTYGEVLP